MGVTQLLHKEEVSIARVVEASASLGGEELLLR